MKLIIDIPEEVYKNIQGKSAEIQAEGYTVENAVLDGTPIPYDAINDDVLKALFDERGYMGIHDRMMHTKWLFAPYQKGGKE